MSNSDNKQKKPTTGASLNRLNQILIGLLNIVSAKQMLGAWRYIILLSTILGAILTPSTDPLTQLLLSAAILLLYFSGVGILFLIKN